jgi:hypothetical protein
MLTRSSNTGNKVSKKEADDPWAEENPQKETSATKVEVLGEEAAPLASQRPRSWSLSGRSTARNLGYWTHRSNRPNEDRSRSKGGE